MMNFTIILVILYMNIIRKELWFGCDACMVSHNILFVKDHNKLFNMFIKWAS